MKIKLKKLGIPALILLTMLLMSFVPYIGDNYSVIVSHPWKSTGLACYDSVIHGNNVGIKYNFLNTGELVVTGLDNVPHTSYWSLSPDQKVINITDPDPDSEYSEMQCPISNITPEVLYFRLPIQDASLADSIADQLNGYHFEMRLARSN